MQAVAHHRLIIFFRNDLRLRDNEIVHQAVRKIRNKEATDVSGRKMRGDHERLAENALMQQVVPIYSFDPRCFAKAKQSGYGKTGVHRAKFLLEGVIELKNSLRSIGSDLIITCSHPEELIASLRPEGVDAKVTVLTQEEPTSEELRVDRKIRETLGLIGRSSSLQHHWGSTVYHKDDVLAALGGLKQMPNVFSPFKDLVEGKVQIRKELPRATASSLPLPSLPSSLLNFIPKFNDLPWPDAPPSEPEPHPSSVMIFKGGEEEGLKRLKHYLWDTDAVATYFETRNGLLGPDYSTKFAPWISAGCLSPRTIYYELQRYQSERTSNKSTYWVFWELQCRDYFHFFALKHGNDIFKEGGTVRSKSQLWNKDPAAWQRWVDGETGLPLVDANMKELKLTGWMSNRGRQNVASYLIHDLKIDWRLGAEYFESLLLDHDVKNNWGNWVAMAGLTGGRVNVFNIVKQGKDYDPNGDYCKTWLPELKALPPAHIHEPFAMNADERDRYKVTNYPMSMTAPRSYSGPPQAGGRGGGGKRGGGGRGGGNSGGRGQKKSEFERFG